MAIPEVIVGDLTESTLNGEGIFDVLMRSVKVHLDGEFNAGRIKGPEYTTVYLGSLDLAMQTAMTYLTQSRKVSRELELLDKQIILAQSQIDLQNQQRLNAVSENGAIEANKGKLLKEIALVEANTRRTEAEISLLAQKTATEQAQTKGANVDADSVLGRQKTLYSAQSDGFLRDAEQKATKLLVDTWSVRRTTDEGTVADGVNKLNDVTLGRAVEKLLLGIQA